MIKQVGEIDWNLDIPRYHCANHIRINFPTIVAFKNIEQVGDKVYNMFDFMNCIQIGINFDNVPYFFYKFVFVRIIVHFRMIMNSYVITMTEARHGSTLCSAHTYFDSTHVI